MKTNCASIPYAASHSAFEPLHALKTSKCTPQKSFLRTLNFGNDNIFRNVRAPSLKINANQNNMLNKNTLSK